MTRARGNRLQNALAAYLAAWWPHAESAGAGRQGTDVLGTPGVVWEAKTAVDFKRDFKPTVWVAQSIGHMAKSQNGRPDDIPVVVYFPPGVGAMRTAHVPAIVPLHVLMQILEEGGYVPDKPRECACEENRLYGTCGHLRTNQNDRRHGMTSGDWAFTFVSAVTVLAGIGIWVAYHVGFNDGHEDGRLYQRNRDNTRALDYSRLIAQPVAWEAYQPGRHAPFQPRLTVTRTMTVDGGPAGLTAPMMHRLTDSSELRALVARTDDHISQMKRREAAYRGELIS